MHCRYNVVNFLPNPHKIHPIARTLGWAMGCILWFDTAIYILLESTQCCMKYRVIFDRVITALDCIRFDLNVSILWVVCSIGLKSSLTHWDRVMHICVCNLFQQLNFNENKKNHSRKCIENIVYKTTAILSRPQCVNPLTPGKYNWYNDFKTWSWKTCYKLSS